MIGKASFYPFIPLSLYPFIPFPAKDVDDASAN
jgi:hypothetical protein